MTWLQKIVALLFVALWLPTTMHCSLEKLPGLQFLECSSDKGDADCSTDGCQIIEAGHYKVSDNTAVVPVPVIGFVCAVLVDVESIHETGADLFDRISPTNAELPQRWQFLQRTATPARAPSFLS